MKATRQEVDVTADMKIGQIDDDLLSFEKCLWPHLGTVEQDLVHR